MNLLKLNDTTKVIPIFMADSSTPTAGKTGLTVSVRLAKNGAAFGAAAGTVTELEGGNYILTPSSGDTGTLGPLNVRATASGALDFNTVKQVVAFDPYAASNLGLTNLDAAISTRSVYAGGAVASVTGNVGGSVASVTAPVTVGTNNDKTGYSLTTAPPTSAVIAAAVWDLSTSGHTTGGSFGAAMNAAGSAGDPWSPTLPGSYAAGSAGYAVGHNLDAQVSTRSVYAGGAVASVTAPVTVGTNNDKTGYILAPSGFDNIVVETSVNPRQALSLTLAAVGGQLAVPTGAGTAVAKNAAGISRIQATVDGTGNRTAATWTPPA